ncbi:MAG: M24 family metallopeptidase [Deltaproteobacteria bacterium]|nr:M24 family metallopeptidase [Deltaproteobacteria bacterium]
MQADRLAAMQAAVAEEGLDAWLFCDFRGSDPIAARILELGDRLATRRWFYLVPTAGAPRGLVSAVEPAALRGLPGAMRVYRTWQELHAGLAEMLAGLRTVAMQYSPLNAVPYVARVDAGTVELVRGCGVEVRTAADLVQRFEAVWSAAQYASHCRAARAVRAAVDAAFAEIGARCRAGRPCDEGGVQRFLLERFAQDGLVTHHPPIVAAGPHSADPHYETPAAGRSIGAGEFVLIDLWAKEPDGVYADITWTGYVGRAVPERHAAVFDVVRRARDAGVAAARRGLADGTPLRGCDVDAATRGVIEAAGYGPQFVHRTGHSIGVEVHGNGANIDGFETPDTRRLLPGTCFSVEPGVYLPGEFGVRSELNAFVDRSEIVVTGEPIQTAVVAILGDAAPRTHA